MIAIGLANPFSSAIQGPLPTQKIPIASIKRPCSGRCYFPVPALASLLLPLAQGAMSCVMPIMHGFKYSYLVLSPVTANI